MRGFVVWIFLASMVFSSSGCGGRLSKRYDVPELGSADEQLKFAEELAARYKSPLYKKQKGELAGEALAAYRKVIALYPNEGYHVGRSKLGMAIIHDREGDLSAALKEYEFLIEKYPQDEVIQVYALDGAAHIADRKGRVDDAKNYYKQIIDRFKTHANPAYRQIALRAEYAYRRVRER